MHGLLQFQLPSFASLSAHVRNLHNPSSDGIHLLFRMDGKLSLPFLFTSRRFFLFFLSLAALLASFLSENPPPSSCCCFPCSIAAAASPLERRRLRLRGRNPFCPFPNTPRPPPPAPPLHNLLALLSWNLLLFTIWKPRS